MIQVITEELGMNLENFEPQMLGTCKKVGFLEKIIVFPIEWDMELSDLKSVF